ncbi:MAG: hypothetical protein ACRENC_08245, partial [Gemmatimonadaceae bacterium]
MPAPVKFFVLDLDEMRPTFAIIAILLAAPAAAQQPVTDITVDAITHGAFASAPLPEPHWLADGSAYLDLRRAPGGGSDIVRVTAVTGATTVVAAGN